jgi:lipopolysaccharide/colanic/teichoic acid biosynthesis glycosyltransferase
MIKYINIKSILDKFFIIVSMPLLIPLFLFVAIAIRIKLGKGVLFTQLRGGYKNSQFLLYKFRSMTNEVDANGKLLTDDVRLTKFGMWLRDKSLDELPSLINVLKGEMSLVGPRPFVAKYLSLYNEEQKKRHNVLPGLTGWAQIKGRNSISWDKKFEYDVWYVNNISFFLDLKILFATVFYVVLAKNINEDGYSTASDFENQIKM